MSSTLFARGVNTQVGVRQRAEKMAKELADVKELVQKYPEGIEGLKGQVEAAAVRISELEKKGLTATVNVRISELETKLQVTDARAHTSDQESKGHATRISDLEGKIQALEEKISAAEDRSSMTEKVMLTLVERIKKLEAAGQNEASSS